MFDALKSRDGSIFAAAFAAGFVAFALLYSPQPILNLLSAKFDVAPHVSALVISLPTFFLSVSSMLMLYIGGMAALGRIVPLAIMAAALINMVAVFSPVWLLLVVARGLMGILVGLVPASVMGLVAGEIRAERMGRAMSCYIAGTGSGGLIGRLSAGVFAGTHGYELALGSVSLVAFVVGVVLWFRFPASRAPAARPANGPVIDFTALKTAIVTREAASVYVLCFLQMAAFIGIFNYLSYLLSSSKFGLSQSSLTFGFLPMACGIVAVPLLGYLFDRLGPRTMLCFSFAMILAGALLSLTDSLPQLFIAITTIAMGAFAGHSSASATLGRLTSVSKTYASSLYMFFFYLGASVGGYFTGMLYTFGGWELVVAFTAVLSVLGTAVTVLAVPNLPAAEPARDGGNGFSPEG